MIHLTIVPGAYATTPAPWVCTGDAATVLGTSLVRLRRAVERNAIRERTDTIARPRCSR